MNPKNINILVLGASGQLGQCIRKVSEERALTDIVFAARNEGNILLEKELELTFEKYNPKYVINCAAYTAVDRAEDDLDLCRAVNRDAVLNIVALCRQYQATLVHVSTDFVFEGNSVGLLKEDDIAEPINVYGLTKLQGEKLIIDNLNAYYILRTSWLYSEYGNNFLKTMLKLAADRDELSVIADQIGTPTYAIDLAGAILDIIASAADRYGLYHYSNEGVTSWYDFAVGIFYLSSSSVSVNPILTAQYPTRARRPKFSVMDKTKIKSAFGLKIPYWKESLAVCISRLQLRP